MIQLDCCHGVRLDFQQRHDARCRHVGDGPKVLPFVGMFCGTPSQFSWDDELGIVNHIPQNEWGEQGDSLPAPSFSIWATQPSLPSQLTCTEAVCTDLDIYHSLATHLWKARIWRQEQ